MSESIQDILFVELVGGIGDLLIALPAIHATARSHPDARLNVLTFPAHAELIEKDPLIARIFTTPPEGGSRDYLSQTETLRDVMASERFDVVVFDASYGGIDRLVEGSGARRKVSHLRQRSSGEESIEERLVSLLVDEGLVDAAFRGLIGRIALSSDERLWARVWLCNNLPGRKRSAVIHPGAGMAIKRWPTERFVSLGKWLAQEAELNVIISAGDENRLAEEIALGVGADAFILPKTGLRKFAAMVAEAVVFASVDTGPARVAAAVGTYAIVLFGPSWAGLYGLRESSVNLQSPRPCPERMRFNFAEQSCWQSGVCIYPEIRSCVEDIGVEMVVSEIRKVL